METIGQRLKYLRESKNLSMKDVNTATAISTGNLSSYENDRFKPAADALISLSKIYDASIDWILKGEYYGDRFDIKDIDLLSKLSHLSDPDMEEILMLINHKNEKATLGKSSASKLGKKTTASRTETA